eukprot:EG_transcript_8425
MATTEHYGTFPHRPKGTLRFASEPCLPHATKCPVPIHAHSAAEVDTQSNLARVYTFRPLKQGPAAPLLDRCLAWVLPPGSFQSSMFNLCSATLGGGSLSLSFAFMKASILPTLALLFIAGAATVYSIWLLIRIYELTGVRTYEESTESLVGIRMRHLVEGLTIAFCYGCAVAYVIAVGDALAPLEAVYPHWSRRTWMVLFWAVFMLPPSCQRAVNSLRFTSFFGMCAMLYLTFAITYHALSQGSIHPDVEYFTVRWDALASMPIVLFAYTCQVNVFAIYDELVPQTPHGMQRVTLGAVGFCFLIYCLVGISGYCEFGPSTMGNILSNYDLQHSPVIQLAYVAMAIAITMGFPLVMYPLRTSLALMLFNQPQLEWPAHLGGTLILSALILLAAIYLPGINVVFQLLGSTTSSLLCFIIPAILAWKVELHRLSWAHRLGIAGTFGLGCFIGVLGTAITVLGLLQS